MHTCANICQRTASLRAVQLLLPPRLLLRLRKDPFRAESHLRSPLSQVSALSGVKRCRAQVEDYLVCATSLSPFLGLAPPLPASSAHIPAGDPSVRSSQTQTAHACANSQRPPVSPPSVSLEQATAQIHSKRRRAAAKPGAAGGPGEGRSNPGGGGASGPVVKPEAEAEATVRLGNIN